MCVCVFFFFFSVARCFIIAPYERIRSLHCDLLSLMENWSIGYTNIRLADAEWLHRQGRSHWWSLTVLGGAEEAALLEDELARLKDKAGNNLRFFLLLFVKKSHLKSPKPTMTIS